MTAGRQRQRTAFKKLMKARAVRVLERVDVGVGWAEHQWCEAPLIHKSREPFTAYRQYIVKPVFEVRHPSEQSMRNRPTDVGRQLARLFRSGTVGGMTDPQLLEQFVCGDDESASLAFETIVERHGPMVLRVCRTVLRDMHDAEDAFQATFLVLARRARDLGSRDLLANWLYGVAARTAQSQGGRCTS